MKTGAQPLNLRRSRVWSFCKSYGVELLILFGSHSRQATHSRSDLDLAIQFRDASQSIDRLLLLQKLDELVGGIAPVDLVVLTPYTDVVLRNEVFSSGRVLYEHTKGTFVKEQWKAWTSFQDAKPLLNRHHRAFMEHYFNQYPHVS